MRRARVWCKRGRGNLSTLSFLRFSCLDGYRLNLLQWKYCMSGSNLPGVGPISGAYSWIAPLTQAGQLLHTRLMRLGNSKERVYLFTKSRLIPACRRSGAMLLRNVTTYPRRVGITFFRSASVRVFVNSMS